MEELKIKPPLLGRLGYNLIKMGILEEAFNPSTMKHQEGGQCNPKHQEDPHSHATIVP